MIQKHNEQSIKDTIANNSKVAVRFTADWCGPCRSFAPIFGEVATEEKDITFIVADADLNQALAQEYGVRGLPSVVFFYDGHKIGMVSGNMTADKFREVIKKQFDR